MKSYEIKDFIIKFINKEIKTLKKNNDFKAGIVTIEYDRIVDYINQPEIDYQTIKTFIDSLVIDNLFGSIAPTYQSITLRPTAFFYETSEAENGWYTNIFFKKKLELELLTTRLEQLELQIQKLQTDTTLASKLSNLANLSSLISNTIEGISKLSL